MRIFILGKWCFFPWYLKAPFSDKWSNIHHFEGTLRYLHNQVENIIITLTKELYVSRGKRH